MTNSRPSRPRPSKPSMYGSSPSSSDADKRMGADTNTTLPDAKVVKVFGNWTVETYKDRNGRKSIAVSNGRFIDYPVFYTHKQAVGYDYPERVPQSVKNYLFKNHNRFLKVESQ